MEFAKFFLILWRASQSKFLAKISNDAVLMLQAQTGNVGLKNLYPDTTRYPLEKSKRKDNIIDFVHAIMWHQIK
jgi:hypothetical protein